MALRSTRLVSVLQAQPVGLQVRSLSTMRIPVARMLLSTNQSRAVDISHDKELQKGLKTSGEKQDKEDPSKISSVSDQVNSGAKEVKDVAKEMLNRTGDKVNKSALNAADRMQDMSDRAEGTWQETKDKARDKMNQMGGNQGNTPADRATDKMLDVSDQTEQTIRRTKDMMKDKSGEKEMQQTKKKMGEAINLASDGDDGMSDRTRDSMWKAGNQRGVPEETEDAAKRMQGVAYNSTEMSFKSDDSDQKGKDGKAHLSQAAKDSYDIPKKVEQDAKMSKQDDNVDKQHIQPGTRNLSGTRDNFDNDPGVSIDMMQDKIRETKDKITGGKDHVIENVKQSMKQTTGGIMDSVKGLTDAAKETVQGAATKTKEFLTGERNDEKPDETKSQVRTGEGVFPPGTKVDKDGKPKGKEGQSWQ